MSSKLQFDISRNTKLKVHLFDRGNVEQNILAFHTKIQL